MNRLIINILVIIAIISFVSCKKKVHYDADAASIRIENSVNYLNDLLINETNGWHITYFPNVDKSLNTDITENIKTSARSLVKYFLRDRLGVGGYNIYVKFGENGVCRMFSDIPNIAINNEQKLSPLHDINGSDVSYKIFIADGLSLKFTSNNPIENLFDASLNAKTGFNVVSIDKDTKTITLATNSYEDDDREFIIMKPLQESFDNVPNLLDRIINNSESFRQRLYTSQTNNSKALGRCYFIVTTKEDEEEVYRSTSSFSEKIIDDRISMQIPSRRDNRTINLIYDYDIRRYTLFIKNEEPDKTIGTVDNSQYYTSIGSGYVPTSEGLFFYPGFNYLDIANFQTFVKVGSKEWVSEDNVYKAKIVFINE